MYIDTLRTGNGKSMLLPQKQINFFRVFYAVWSFSVSLPDWRRFFSSHFTICRTCELMATWNLHIERQNTLNTYSFVYLAWFRIWGKLFQVALNPITPTHVHTHHVEHRTIGPIFFFRVPRYLLLCWSMTIGDKILLKISCVCYANMSYWFPKPFVRLIRATRCCALFPNSYSVCQYTRRNSINSD